MDPKTDAVTNIQSTPTLFNELVPPDEITLNILSYLTYSERSALSHVNRFFNNLCSDQKFWKHQCEKYFYPEQIGSDELEENETWRSRFHNIMSTEKTRLDKAFGSGRTDLTTSLNCVWNKIDRDLSTIPVSLLTIGWITQHLLSAENLYYYPTNTPLHIHLKEYVLHTIEINGDILSTKLNDILPCYANQQSEKRTQNKQTLSKKHRSELLTTIHTMIKKGTRFYSGILSPMDYLKPTSEHWKPGFLLYYFQHSTNRSQIEHLLDENEYNKDDRSSGHPTFPEIDLFLESLFSSKSFWKKLMTYQDLLIKHLGDLSVLPDMLEDPECFKLFIYTNVRDIEGSVWNDWFERLIRSSEEITPHLTARFLNLLSSTSHFQTAIWSFYDLERLLLLDNNQNVENFLINRLIEPNNFAHTVRNMEECDSFLSRIHPRATETSTLSVCHAMQHFLRTYLNHLNEILQPHSKQHAKSLLYFLLNTNYIQFPNLRDALSCEKSHLQAIKSNIKSRQYNSPENREIIKQMKRAIKEITNTLDQIQKATLVGHQTLEFNKLKDGRHEFKPLMYETLGRAEAFCHKHPTLSLDYTWLIETLYKINNISIPFKITEVKQLLLIAGTPETQLLLAREQPDEGSLGNLDWRNLLLIQGNTTIFLNAYNNYASRLSPNRCLLNGESFLYFAILSGNLEFIEFMGRWYMENQADIAMQTEVLPHILSIQTKSSIKKITQSITNMNRPDLLLWLVSHGVTLPERSKIQYTESNKLTPYLTSYHFLLAFENDMIGIENGLVPSYAHITTTKTLASFSITSPISGATFTPIKLGGSSKQTTTLRFLHRLREARQLSQPMVDVYVSSLLTGKRILMNSDKHNKVLGRCLSYSEFRQSDNPDNLFIMGKHFAEGDIVERDEIIANEQFTTAKELFENTGNHEKANQCNDEIKALNIDEKPTHRFLSFSGG